ncbi:MAG: hypothetical protein ACRESW_00830, partial [Nevskiales bacterium]
MQQAMTSHSAVLLEAGVRLARRAPLSRITTAVIATEAGLPSVRFFDAYPDLTHYLIDLYQQHFLLPTRELIEVAQARLPPGIERTRTVTQIYFDFCLKHHGLRRWTIEARSWPGFEAAYRRDSKGLQALARIEIQPLGFSDIEGAARLYAAMLYEITTVEMQDGHEHGGLRQGLWRLLGFTDRPVLSFPARPAVVALPQAMTVTPRQRLLRAGEQLLRDKGGDPDVLQLDALLARADVDQASFEAAFGDLKNFQLVLVQSWAEYFMTSCLAASQGLAAGTERIHAFMTTAWNCNLHQQRGYRLLMKALLARDEELRARILTRVHSFTRIVATEFQALGVPSPQAMARLFVAASTELVEVEEAAVASLPRLRETFWQWFDPLTVRIRAGARKASRLSAADDAVQGSFLSLQIGSTSDGRLRRRLSARTAAALRQQLLEAGDRLLLSGAAATDITPNRLALLAGVEPEELARCYPDFDAYRTELLALLLDEARDIAVEATAHQPPGIASIWRGIETYLDARLDRAATHELSRLLQGYPAAARFSRGRSAGFARIIATALQAIDWQHPQENAHLIIALVSETVQAEYEAGRRLPEYRATLHAFLTRG